MALVQIRPKANNLKLPLHSTYPLYNFRPTQFVGYHLTHSDQYDTCFN